MLSSLFLRVYAINWKLPMVFFLGTALSAPGGALSITIARRLEDLALIKNMQFSISNV